MCDRPARETASGGLCLPLDKRERRGSGTQRHPGRSGGRGPKAKLTMVPTNSAQWIIPHKPRREDGRGKEGGSDDTLYRGGRNRPRRFPPVRPPPSCVVGCAGSVASGGRGWGVGGLDSRHAQWRKSLQMGEGLRAGPFRVELQNKETQKLSSCLHVFLRSDVQFQVLHANHFPH